MALSDFRLGTAATQHAGTGTVTVPAGTTALNGSGTAFTTELHVGDVLISGGQILSVATIVSNDSATLALPVVAALTLAAFVYNPLVNLETLFGNINAPRPTFKFYADRHDLGDSTRRGYGRPAVTWQWGFLTVTHRNLLRAYCPGDSARVYLRTRQYDNADALATYLAVMLWPDEQRDALSIRVPFALDFRDLVQL